MKILTSLILASRTGEFEEVERARTHAESLEIPKCQKPSRPSGNEGHNNEGGERHKDGAQAARYSDQVPIQIFDELVETPSLLICSAPTPHPSPETEKHGRSYTEGWARLSCPGCKSVSQCCLHADSWSSILVLDSAKVLAMQVPNLRCKSHPKRAPFSVLEIWHQVVQACDKQEVFVHPDIVVLSDKLVLTGQAYRYDL
jgi:hypothetical protein